MAVERGDTLIMSQNGLDIVVQAQTEVVDGLVQIKNNGTHSPCPSQDLHEPWILADPDGPIYVQPDGQTTNDPRQAKLFKGPAEAEKFRKSKTGIPYFVPRKLKECLAG